MNVRNFEPGDLVANILDIYVRTDAKDIESGAVWYANRRAECLALARVCNLSVAQVAATFAALSPRYKWLYNQRDAEHFCQAAGFGEPQPRSGQTTVNRDKAWGFASGATNPANLTGIKCINFAANLLCLEGPERVTVDTWACRIATAWQVDTVGGDENYKLLAAAYVTGANLLGIRPYELQAITWEAARHGLRHS